MPCPSATTRLLVGRPTITKYFDQRQLGVATIAYRLGVNHLRKKKIEISDIPEEGSFTAHFISDENPEESLEDQEMNTLVLKLVDQLPAQYKIVLTLYHVDQMNYQEIENVTGMPEGTVKNYLFRARHLLTDVTQN